MIRKAVSIFLVISLWCPLAVATGLCQSDNLPAWDGKTGAFSSLEALFQSTADKSILHVFGEAHYNTDVALIQAVIAGMAPHLSGSKGCLFLEMPLGGLKYFAEQIADAKRLAPDRFRDLEPYERYYSAMTSAAEKAGLSVHEIDHPDHIQNDKTIDERNLFMADKARELLNADACDSAIFFVGKAHVSALDEVPTVIARLRENGLEPVTYNIRDQVHLKTSQGYSWDGLACTSKIDPPAAFSTQILKEDTVFWPNYFSSPKQMLWRDFHYSIMKAL